VVRFPPLAAEVLPRMVPGLRWYSFLQHASTVVGTLVIFAWLWRLARRFPPELRRYPPGEARRAVKVALGLGFASALAAASNGARVWGARLPVFLAYAAVGAMAGFAVAVALYGVWSRLRRSRVATARAREG
jgi:hypothetical protein